MRHRNYLAYVVLTVFIAFLAVSPQPAYANAESDNSCTMYRLYNPNTGEHLYTASTKERDTLKNIGWRYEGVGWTAPTKSKTPVYRLYNPYASGGDHHYTTNEKEYNSLQKVGWKGEGVAWYSDDAKGVPLYRQYNPYAATGTHNYTASKSENNSLVKLGWKEEGVGWYGLTEFGWLVGTWQGTLTETSDPWQYGTSWQCYGGKAYPPTVTVKSVDSQNWTMVCDLKFIVHNHATPTNQMTSSDGDTYVELKNVTVSFGRWSFSVADYNGTNPIAYSLYFWGPPSSGDFTLGMGQKYQRIGERDVAYRRDTYSLTKVS